MTGIRTDVDAARTKPRTIAPPTTLAELLPAQAERTPNAIAVEDSYGNVLTYAGLDELAARIAAKLRDMGVVRGDRVGIDMPKCVNSVACVHGILRAGAAYVPVDYASPAERNRYIFTNCQAKVICTDEQRAETLVEDGRPVAELLCFPGEASSGVGSSELSAPSPQRAFARPDPSDLAYILYTSGSTGLPKGVMHTHASAMSFVNWVAETIRPVADDRFSSHAPFHFDLSILDLYVPMTVGGSVIIIGEELGKQPRELAEFIARKKITSWYSVPSILALLVQFGKLDVHDYSALRTVCFAGEVFPVKHLRELLAAWPKKDYYNLYGPTETNVCTYYKVQPEDHRRTTPLPIGRVCSNARGVVVDDQFRPVAPGEEGMLYIHCSGPTMLGYWNDPDRTNASIHVDAAGERWYRTGDLVMQQVESGRTESAVIAGEQVEIATFRRDAKVPNGELSDEAVLAFIGRRDRMVKRHGYRIELGEIEAGLYKLEGIGEAAAVAVDSPAGDAKVIVAFLSMKENAAAPGVIALKLFCAKHLPSYMSPDRFIVLERLPRTSTEKINYPELMRMAERAMV